MRFIATLIYLFLKLVVNLVYRIFYSKFTVINEERLKFKNAAIVVSNHPSTLMDPLNSAVKVRKQVSFLANASLFKNKAFGAFLKLYCIPIERPKDVEGRRIKNEENFARADRHLGKHRCIYIAPEGTSVVERRIRRVKTGTARIALSAENKKDFNLGVTIVPIGLTYSDPLNFQKDLIVNVGQPLVAADYKAAYQKNPIQAAKKLTADLQTTLESLVLHTENDQQDQLLSKIEHILNVEQVLSPKKAFLRTKKILPQISSMKESTIAEMNKVADSYFEPLKTEKTNALSFFRSLKMRSSFLGWLKIILGFPLFLYGWINNFFAFFVPGYLAKVIKVYHGYRPAIMNLAGLIFLPLFFYIQTKLVQRFIDIPYIGWIYLLTLLPMGWLAWQYRKFLLQFFKDQKAKSLKSKASKKYETIKTNRENFLSLIHKNIEF